MNLPNSLFATMFIGGLLSATPAHAETRDRATMEQGGAVCQLSVPTISSQVRPRATGMRNEGTSNEFVICHASADAPNGLFSDAAIELTGLDGGNRVVQCTAVSGTVFTNMHYSTKTIFTGASPGMYGYLSWTPSDLGGGNTFPSGGFSVTCILPPNASIVSIVTDYAEDVGQ